MLKFTSIVGYTSCGPTYIESFLTIFGQCINVLNYKYIYVDINIFFDRIRVALLPRHDKFINLASRGISGHGTPL